MKLRSRSNSPVNPVLSKTGRSSTDASSLTRSAMWTLRPSMRRSPGCPRSRAPRHSRSRPSRDVSRRRAGRKRNAARFLRRRQFGAALCRRQIVDREISRLPVERQLEPVGQERLQHQPHLLRIGVGLRFGLDIVAIGIDPGRTSYHLRSRQGEPVAVHGVVVDRVRKLDEKRQGRVAITGRRVDNHSHRVFGSVHSSRKYFV